MPTQNIAASVQQAATSQPYFGEGGKNVSEAAALIIGVATVITLTATYFNNKVKAAFNLHTGIHTDIDKQLAHIDKSIEHEKNNRKAVDDHLQTQINDVREDRTKDVERIVRLETRFEGIMNGIDEIKMSIREIRNGTNKD